MFDRSSKLIRDLTDQPIHGSDALTALQRFASEFGWRPSDQLDRYPGTEQFCNGHLVVEHGFDLTAVISFLRTDTPYLDLSTSDRRTLLELSYNNLVDWHLLPERSGMRVVFNRTDPPHDHFVPATATENVWRADAFDRLTGKRPNPNVKALDDALIDTVSFWKRAIRSDLGEDAELSHISAMINSVIMVRALEDYRARRSPLSKQKLLLELLDELPAAERNAKSLIRTAFARLDQPNPPQWIQEIMDSLTAFDSWDVESLAEFVGDFYRSRFAPYRYNFDLISKHALSRIYEHYVSTLRSNAPSDLMLFRELPEAIDSKDVGGVYTPQYIARFFARYVKENRTPRAFRSLRTIDPACGSGMFLRTMLEMQCDPSDDAFSRESVRQSFANTHGIDVDPSACQAARLSLALLHMVLTGEFPQELHIQDGEAIACMERQAHKKFDVVVANPPFVKWDGLSTAIRQRLSEYMREQGFGKQDLYLAFVKTAIEHTDSEGGLLCFVLPHSFLLSKGAAAIRRQLSSEFAIRVLADLSEVRVFEKTGAYVILLVAERTSDRHVSAMVVQCREFVGSSLQDALARQTRSGNAYHVFEVDQSTFQRERWHLLRPVEAAVRDAIETHPQLPQFVQIRQGLITGKDEVFIRPSRECPASERQVWRPLLRDREMVRFGVPARPAMAVFMPFAQSGERLTETRLRSKYPETWQYLKRFRKELAQRSTVSKNGRPWWEPAWPRSPAKLFVPKIVTPHLILLPRFGVDEKGKYAVSHCPYLVPQSETGGLSLLKFICAVMNSAIGHWQLASSSHKYSRGYLMLEVKTLRDFHIPDPASLAVSLTRRIVRLADKLGVSPDETSTLAELDGAVGDAYGLSASQISLVTGGG